MQHHPKKLIEYFRRCYQADSYDLSLNNILNLKSNRRLFLDERDYWGLMSYHVYLSPLLREQNCWNKWMLTERSGG
ncbi:hypothetical protein [Microbulbifer sp. VAAF005]|uniref:hypothetical protein n=1 Tax=Microbulbifer sp. VAAF005 TaxID=3034230 RepID=UPI0024AD8AC1|nr:hypothetical protein [Microbulbifer sp. VAAF005]WHI47784.1 hypothetical protein P0078_05145 [Microbulbifer sp. VAAF005]